MLTQGTHIILNPASRAGRTGRLQKTIEDVVGRRLKYSLSVTTGIGDAERITGQAIREGCDVVVVVGGDGTINEVVNGFIENGKHVHSSSTLGIISSGTGQGFAQSLKLPTALEQQIDAAMGGTVRRVDIARISFREFNGSKQERMYVNECQIGIGAEIVRNVRNIHKRLGGRMGFGLGTVLVSSRYRAQPLEILVDDEEKIEGNFLGVIVANGTHAGGGMCLAPRARLDDGLLDVVLIHDQSFTRRLRSFLRIYSGRHITLPGFGYLQAKKIAIASSEDVPIAADGELFGRLPCRIEILPSALTVKITGP